MVKYEAIEDIGDFKVGDEVPAEKALIWMKMYVKSPIKIIGAESSKKDKSIEKDVIDADVNNDGKVDFKDAIEVVKRIGRRSKGKKK